MAAPQIVLFISSGNLIRSFTLNRLLEYNDQHQFRIILLVYSSF